MSIISATLHISINSTVTVISDLEFYSYVLVNLQLLRFTKLLAIGI